MRVLCLVLLPLAVRCVPNLDEALADEAFQEAIADGRGDRDEVGVREEWASMDREKRYDSRRPPSPKVRRLLSTYRLECEGCDHDEATDKINEFVSGTRRKARFEEWLWRAALGGFGLAAAFLVYRRSAGAASDRERRNQEIEDRRRRAAAMEKSKLEAAKKSAAPSWREVEEREVWTPRQEKKFAKAIAALAGVPAKKRYDFVAERVRDKTRLECLMHHKLLKARAKDR